MRKLLIVERNAAICQELNQMFSDMWDIHFCNNAEDAISKLRSTQFDSMILSLSISKSLEEISPIDDWDFPWQSEYHGVSVLSTVFPYLPPTIIVFSSVATNFMAGTAYSWGANYLFEYPIEMDKLKLALDYSIGQQLPAKLSARHLNVLGARPGLDGTWCVIAAIPYLMQDPSRKLGQDVYNHVARVCGMTDYRDVDRAIRFMINNAWENHDPAIWSLYFPTNKNGEIERPKSKDFIKSILQKVM